jgi:hypothetical protein
MSQSIVLILTRNIQPADIERCLKDKFDTSITANARGGLNVLVAERDKFGTPVNYVTVSEFPREETEADYKTNDFIDRAFVEDLDGHVFYGLRFNERRLFDAVLKHLLRHAGTNLKRTWIDNDYGVVLPAAVVFEPGDWKEQRPASD